MPAINKKVQNEAKKLLVFNARHENTCNRIVFRKVVFLSSNLCNLLLRKYLI
jgi:hypothetical protein